MRRLETVAPPEVDLAEITHQKRLRSMDALMDHQDEVDAELARLLDQDLSEVFYDLATIRSGGLVTVEKDVRKQLFAPEGAPTHRTCGRA